ncbi:hypothetical protein LXL04_000609 [Taraxacum kok-saghyz]
MKSILPRGTRLVAGTEAVAMVVVILTMAAAATLKDSSNEEGTRMAPGHLDGIRYQLLLVGQTPMGSSHLHSRNRMAPGRMLRNHNRTRPILDRSRKKTETGSVYYETGPKKDRSQKRPDRKKSGKDRLKPVSKKTELFRDWSKKDRTDPRPVLNNVITDMSMFKL